MVANVAKFPRLHIAEKKALDNPGNQWYKE